MVISNHKFPLHMLAANDAIAYKFPPTLRGILQLSTHFLFIVHFTIPMLFKHIEFVTGDPDYVTFILLSSFH